MTETEYTAPVQIVVDPEKFLDQIQWRKQVPDYYDGGSYERTGEFDPQRDLASHVAVILARQLRKEMTDVVRDTVKEVAQEQVAGIIADLMAEGFQMTNTFGEPSGERVTMRELVVGEVKGQLERRVNRNGHKAETYDRDALPYVQYVAANAAREALNGELNEATKTAVAEVKAKVTNLVAEQLGAQIARAVTR